MDILGYIVVEHPEGERPDLDHAVLHPTAKQAHFWAELREGEGRGRTRYTVHAVPSEPVPFDGVGLVGLVPGIFGVCQVVHSRLDLPCPHREGGGRQCEMFGPHKVPEECALSEHTIRHARAGNGYACSAITPPLPSPEGL